MATFIDLKSNRKCTHEFIKKYCETISGECNYCIKCKSYYW